MIAHVNFFRDNLLLVCFHLAEGYEHHRGDGRDDADDANDEGNRSLLALPKPITKINLFDK